MNIKLITLIFIWSVFGIIVLFDVFLLVTKRATITSVFRKWYKEFPLVPYMVGGAFIGHFGVYLWNNLLPLNISLWFFIIVSLIIMIYYIVMYASKLKWSRKFFTVCCRFFFIPMAIGTLIGSFWR